MWDKFVSLQKIYWGEMLNLIGTFDCKVDSKGRVLIPSSLKKQLTGHSKDGFIIKRSVFNKVGNFSAGYEWTYNRDVDYCLRAREAEFKIYQIPVKLLHYESKDNKQIKAQDPNKVKRNAA